MSASLLTALQRQVLDAFFRREQRFFLSGGAALAGFHLAHRRTHDLDLFTTADIIEDGERMLALAAEALGATIEKIQTAPDFRRRIVRRGEEAVVVDLVRDRAPQGPLPKQSFGDIRVDPPQEILANKLCALLSRSELRDLIDVYALEQAGFRVEDALALAEKKDAGLTPAQLAWVLSQIDLTSLPEGKIVLYEGYGLPPSASAPEAAAAGIPTRRELLGYLAELSKRLVGRAVPHQ
ncbi:MAG: hypothetical protein NVS2B9_13570 [Myxococcales bacterium]